MAVILISGANGFIGSNLAERLLRDGHRVLGLVRRGSDLAFLEGLAVELLTSDITDKGSLVEPMKCADVAVHVAGLASDWGSFEKFFAVNFIGVQNMAQAAREAGLKRFVHISTAALHGFRGGRHIEETAPMPPSKFAYCQTKKMAEEWLFQFAETTGLEVVVIRPGNVFGPKDHTFIEKYAGALEKGHIAYIDGGRAWTSPTYIENLADAIAKGCFEPAAKGGAFLITDGLKIDWRTFTEKLADELGAKRPTLSIPFWLAYSLASASERVYRLFRVSSSPLLTRYRVCNGGRDYHFSIAKARRLLKYVPVIDFDESIRRTTRWYHSRTVKN